MNEAIVTRVRNRPGELAKVARVLSNANVNIHGVLANAQGEQGAIALVCDDTPAAQEALKQNGTEVEVRRVFAKRLPNRPGAFADLAEKLAENGINVRQVLGTAPTGANEGDIYFDVDEPEKAEQLFK